MRSKRYMAALTGLALLCAGLTAACALIPPAPEGIAEAEPLELSFSPDWYQLSISCEINNEWYGIVDGALYGSGSNYYGILGSDLPIDGGERYENVAIAPDAIHVTVSSIDKALVYIDSAGRLYGLGNNMNGLLREEMTVDQRMNSRQYLVTEPRLLMEDVLYASLGVGHILVIRQDHSLWAWGLNSNGQLGDGSQGTERPYGIASESWPYSAEPMHILDDVVYALAFGYSSAALQSNGDLWTWGDNSFGQIGNGSRGYGLPTISDNIVPAPYLALREVEIMWAEMEPLYGSPRIENLFARDRYGVEWAWGEDYGSTPRPLNAEQQETME